MTISEVRHSLRVCGVSATKLLELVTQVGHDVKIVVGPMRRRVGKVEWQFAEAHLPLYDKTALGIVGQFYHPQ